MSQNRHKGRLTKIGVSHRSFRANGVRQAKTKIGVRRLIMVAMKRTLYPLTALLAVVVVTAASPASFLRRPIDRSTSLRITIQWDIKKYHYRLRCHPASGTVTRPRKLCQAVEQGPALLFPPPATEICRGLSPGVSVAGMVEVGRIGRRVDFSVHLCEKPAERSAVARRWLLLLGFKPPPG